ncbi:MAG: BatD family protein [Xanthobacteraceae bacterium]|nr:BatD family protein [Xanthobacteraceae bacterium]
MPGVSAAQTGPPEPILRVSLDPPKTVVGQQTTLTIDVLAPNYMTKPPVMPDFQLRNAVTRTGATINMSEQHDGITYAGVRFEFLIYPQEPGTYAISGQTVAVTYAAEPPATREAKLTVPAVGFDAVIPDAAQALDPFVSATKLTVRQDIQRSSDQLKVGDAVTRTVTIEVEGMPSMLLPPTTFAPLPGVQVYPAQPQLQDRFDRRTDALTASRVDQATYMLQRPGDLTLPGFEIGWWNVRDQRIERARIERVVLHVADNPLAKTLAASGRRTLPDLREMVLFLLDHWLALVLALAALAGLAWTLPRAARAMAAVMKRRRDAWRQSEAFAYAGLRAAARRGDAGNTYSALLGWLARFEPAAPAHTIGALKAVARDPQLDREIAGIERHLFAPAGDNAEWSAHRLMRQVKRIRRRCAPPRSSKTAALAPAVNPAQPEG